MAGSNRTGWRRIAAAVLMTSTVACGAADEAGGAPSDITVFVEIWRVTDTAVADEVAAMTSDAESESAAARTRLSRAGAGAQRVVRFLTPMAVGQRIVHSEVQNLPMVGR